MTDRQRELQRKVASAIRSRSAKAVTDAEAEYSSLLQDLLLFEHRIDTDLDRQ